MAINKENIRVFENVKIYGYDPNHEADQYGYYRVTIYIKPDQKDFIESFLAGKTDVTKDGEILYKAKSKHPIPLFDTMKNKIETGIDVFIANVSLLFDEFVNDKDETVRYIKPLAIKYISLVPNEPVRIFVKQKFEYDDCFPEETNENKPVDFGMKTKEELNQSIQSESKNPKEFNDLPWDKNGNDVPVKAPF